MIIRKKKSRRRDGIWHCIWKTESQWSEEVPLNFFGRLQTEYEKRNQDYMEELKKKQEQAAGGEA
ncbi:MAG: hypothetical protein V8S12_04825 [Lachnospiraceae bacterium]